ncbi:NAD-dependent protein deacylase [Paenibacillus taiwanensis]|uniref:NAD-dependent protein deacylase n=1 Tax=Paenibacillus taiwanensis TaxID=401638 RepID=UPI00041A9DB0|nr:NAD-dependent protein deacylase [Paenibacillus taiwanensis]
MTQQDHSSNQAKSYETQVHKLAELLSGSRRIVFFGGAGTSTESGIPDFRSTGGVFEEKSDFPHPPEVMVSRPFFERDLQMFYTFYRQKLLHPHAKPNGAHRTLARLEQAGKLKAIITQNIDGLHQAAGSSEVLELHGSVHRNDCLSCHKRFDLSVVLDSTSVIPTCPDCGGVLKPDVVLYGETLNDAVVERAIHYVQQADLLIIGGTSLSVQPAASFAQMGRRAGIVLMNRTPTSMDHEAVAIFRDPMGQLLENAYTYMSKS